MLLRTLTLSLIGLTLATQTSIAQQNRSLGQNKGFIENKGQIANERHEVLDSIDFKLEQNGINAYISPTGVIYHMYHTEKKVYSEMSDKEKAAYNRGDFNEAGEKVYFYRLDFKLLGANRNAEIVKLDELKFKSNYYLAHCLDGITGVSSFGRIQYKDIYENIDLVYKLDGQQLKYEFIVHPGGDVNDIKFTYDGANNLIASSDGLEVLNDYRSFSEQAPITFYEDDNTELIGSEFAVSDDNKTVKFDLQDYSDERTIIIDPTVLWASFQDNGGGSDFHANGAFDSNENIYFAYATYSATWPVINAGAGQYFDATRDGSNDLVIIRYNADLSQQWATYFGGDGGDVLCGTGGDYGKSLAIDDNDDIYVGGRSYSNPTVFPTASSGIGGAFYQDASFIKGGDNAFMAKFDENGVRQWATLYQHTAASSSGTSIRINGIACHGTKVYFTGETYGNFPIPFVTLPGAFNSTSFHGNQGIILGRFNQDCVLEWSTYFNSGSTGGSSSYLQGSDITLDASGNMIMVGQISGDVTPTYLLNPGGGAYYSGAVSGSIDVIISKFNTSMSPVWSTVFGSTELDRVSEVNTDVSGNILIACRTIGGNGMPTQNPGGAFYYATKQSPGTWSSDFSQDGAILKFLPSGQYYWGTYVGGTNEETSSITGVSSDDAGNIYAIGYTNTTDFPTTTLAGSYNQAANAGGLGSQDLVLMKFTSAGADTWSTYYGGSATDQCYGRKIGPSTVASSCGYKQVFSLLSQSTNFPTVNPGGGAFYEGTLTASSANTLLFIEEAGGGGSSEPTSISVAQTAGNCAGENVTLTATGQTVVAGDQLVWYAGGCGSGASIGTGASIVVAPTSNTTYYVRVEGPCGNTACESVTVNVVGTGTEDASWTNPSSVCATGGTINLNTLITGDAGGSWSGTGVTGNTFNPSGLSGNINVTYTVGTSPCEEAVTQAINVIPDVNPVWSAPTNLCESAGTVNLNSFLGGAASGGSWSGTGVSGNNFNPSGLSGSISITYTVGTSPCQETSVQSINVIPDVNPTWSPPSSVCESAGSVNLNTYLGGATSGGTWSGTGVSGNNFNPAGLSGSISITYTVGTAPCQETSVQSINVLPDVDPVWSPPTILCESAGTVNLNTYLGSATSGGTWSGTGVSGNNFNPAGLSGAISITYTVGTSPCQETSSQTITVEPDVDPSWTDPSPVCESGGTVNLNGLITGTPGGTWSGTGVTGSTFDPSGLSGTINITYTVGNGICEETSMIGVSITSTPNPAWTSPGSICEANGTINLDATITGTTGGTWSGTGVSGSTFDPSGLTGSVSITYEVGSGPCLQTLAQNITVTTDVDPSWTNPGTVCDGAGTVNLNGLITGTPGGTWSGTGVTGSTFDPSGLSGQTISITYEVGSSPCDESLTQSITVQSTVTAAWTNPGTICGGGGLIDLSTYITGSTGGTFTGSGVSGNMFDPSALSGNVTITYSVGAGACADAQAQTINVIPDVDPSWTNPSPVCVSNGTIDLSTLVTGTSGGTWSGTGVTGTTFDPAGLGGQSILITYLVGTAPCQEQEVLTVNVTNTVSAAWTAPASVCESDAPIDLSALITGDVGGSFSGTGVSGNMFDPAGLSGSINITYTVGTAPCQDTQVSSINILAAPAAPTVTAVNDTICAGDTTTIDASGSGASIVYNVHDALTGGTLIGQTPLVVQPSTTTSYFIEAVNANNCANIGGRIEIEIVVNPLPIAEAGNDEVICPGDAVTLTATGGTSYLWNTGDMTASISVSPTTDTYYYVTVDDGNCSSMDSVLVSVVTVGSVDAVDDILSVPSNQTSSIDYGANDTGNPNNAQIYVPPSNGTASIVGGILDYTPSSGYLGTDSITYILCDASCGNICDTATIYITVEEDVEIRVPSGVTPNGDGVNDVLVIHGLSQLEHELLIYSRWGDLIFNASPYNNDWNGQSQSATYGDKVVDGTYFYVLTYTNASGEDVKLNGFIEVKSK